MAVSVWPLAAFYLFLALRAKTEIHGTRADGGTWIAFGPSWSMLTLIRTLSRPRSPGFQLGCACGEQIGRRALSGARMAMDMACQRYNTKPCGAPPQPFHSATAASIPRSCVSEALACKRRHALAAYATHCGVHGRTKCFGWPSGFGRKALRGFSGRRDDPLCHCGNTAGVWMIHYANRRRPQGATGTQRPRPAPDPRRAMPPQRLAVRASQSRQPAS